MTITTASILAAMLALQSPGQSPHSLTVVPKGSPKPCPHKFSPLCRAPWYSPHWKAWVRVETADEARKRWAMVSGVIFEVTEKRPELAPYVIATMSHESHGRADVHAGIGPAARGDCKMKKGADGKARCIPGSARAGCLMQVLRRNPTRRGKRIVYLTKRGYTWSSLMGLDRASTRRCIETGTDALAHHYGRCGGAERVPDARCVMGSYFGSRRPTKSKKAAARAFTYRKVVRLLATEGKQ